MLSQSRSLCRLAKASGMVVVLAFYQPVAGQEILPNPAMSLARSANTANGGIDSEWEYHRRANSPSFRPTYTPISRFAGGSGYCTPACIAPYYGCDHGGCCGYGRTTCGSGCSNR